MSDGEDKKRHRTNPDGVMVHQVHLRPSATPGWWGMSQTQGCTPLLLPLLATCTLAALASPLYPHYPQLASPLTCPTCPSKEATTATRWPSQP